MFFKIKPGLRVGDFYQSAETVNGVAFDFLERHQDSRFFLFLHYMDPHDPYFEHPYNGRGIARASNQHPEPSLREEMHRLYKGEIAYLDQHFARLLDKLRELGLYDDTVIALVADHGEEFYEHGGWWHGMTLYDEQVRVPLLVKWARSDRAASQNRRGHVSRLIDVAPTQIARTGAAVPEAMQGIDLASDPASRLEKDRVLFAEEDHEGNVLRALRTADWKWIEANPGNPRGLPTTQLFHVAEDPDETRDIAASDGRIAADLQRQADAAEQFALSQSAGDGTAAELSESQEDALRALGYIE